VSKKNLILTDGTLFRMPGDPQQNGQSTERCPNCNGSGQINACNPVSSGVLPISPPVQVPRRRQNCHRTVSECRGTGKENISGRSLLSTSWVTTIIRYVSAVRVTRGAWWIEWRPFFVILSVQPHEFFKREGDDIYYNLPINFARQH